MLLFSNISLTVVIIFVYADDDHKVQTSSASKRPLWKVIESDSTARSP